MASKEAHDLQIKILTIGDSSVGKTALLNQFANKQFSNAAIPTIGIDFKHVTLTIDGKRVKVQIWDTAGQERFRNITQTYYRKAQGTLLVYDITNRATFESVDTWMKTIQQQAGDSINKILVGNKMDCEAQRQVQKHEGEKLAERYNIKFFETSAKTQQNVADAFETIATECYRRMLSETSQVSSSANSGVTKLTARDAGPLKKKGCC